MIVPLEVLYAVIGLGTVLVCIVALTGR